MQARPSGGARSFRPASRWQRCRSLRTWACCPCPERPPALLDQWASALLCWMLAITCPIPALCHHPCENPILLLSLFTASCCAQALC